MILPLVGNDHGENIRGHHGADERADMDERAAAGEHMGEAPGGSNDQKKDGSGEERPGCAPAASGK